MSNTVDNRVVELQFKNEDFERGVKQTIASLDDLKKALEINTKSLDLSYIQREADSLNLSNATRAVDSLADRFSNLGIVGITIMQRLTNEAINLATRIEKATIGQIFTGGKARAQKVADARFKLDGLLHDAEKLENVMESARNAVTDTAFGMDEAANISSMLVGSGVSIEKVAGGISDLDVALRGIGGAAAMSNSSFEEIGRIFAQVKTAGRLMGQDMMQLQNRTINVVAEIAKYKKVTQEEAKDMIHKGQIDFNTFAAAMDASFGAQAKKSNETLKGVMANVRAALARTGEMFYRGIIENKDLISFFGNLKDKLNSINAALTPMEKPFANFISALAHAGSALLNLFHLPGADKLINLVAKAFDKLASLFEGVAKKFDVVSEKLHLKEAVETAEKSIQVLRTISDEEKKIAQEIWEFGNWGNGEERKQRLGKRYKNVQDYVNAMKEADFDLKKADEIYANMVVEDSEKISDAKEKERQAREGAVKASAERSEQIKADTSDTNFLIVAISTLVKVFQTLTKVAGAAVKAFKNVFSSENNSAATSLLSNFSKLVESFELSDKHVEKIQRAFEGLFTIFKMAGGIIAKVVGFGFGALAKILPTIVGGIISAGEYLGNLILRFKTFITTNAVIINTGKAISRTFTAASKTLKGFFERVIKLSSIQRLKSLFISIYNDVGKRLVDFFTGASESIKDFLGRFNINNPIRLQRFLIKFDNFLNKFIDSIENASKSVKGFLAKFTMGSGFKTANKHIQNLNAGYQKIQKTVANIGKTNSGITGIVENIKSTVSDFGSSIFNKIGIFITKFINVLSKLDVAKMVLMSFSIALIAFAVNLSKFVKTATDTVKSITGFTKSVTNAINGVSQAIGSVKDYVKRKSAAAVIKSWTILFAVAAASIAALAIVNKKYDLKPAVESISILMGVMTAMIIVLSKMSSSQKKAKKINTMMEAFSKMMLGIAGSVFLLASAMYLLSNIQWSKDTWISLGVLVSLMAALIGAMLVIDKFGLKAQKTGVWMIFYAGAVLILATALNKLANLDVQGLKGKMTVLLEAMAIIALVALSASGLSFGSGFAVLAIVSSLVLIELTLKWLIKHGITKEDIANHLDTLVPTFLSLILLTGYMALLSRACKKPEGMAAMIIGIIAAIFAITLSLKAISKLSPGMLILSTLAIGGIFAALYGLIYYIGKYGQANRVKQAGKAVLRIGVAIGILALTLAFLGSLKPETIEQGFGVVAALTALMVAIIFATHFAGQTDAKGFIAMVVVISTMALLVSLMSFIKDKLALLQAAGILGLTLIAFATAIYIAGSKANETAYKTIERMIVAVTAIAASLIALTLINQKSESMLAAAGALSLVLLALGKCAEMMSKAFASGAYNPDKIKTVNKAIMAMSLIALAIGASLSAMVFFTGGNWLSVIAAAAALTLVLAAIAGVLYFLSTKMEGVDSNAINKHIGSINRLLIAIGVISLSMTPLLYFSHSGRQIVAAAGGLSIVLLALAGVCFILSQIPGDSNDLIKKAAGLVVASLAVIPAAYALSKLAGFNWGEILPAAVALGIVLLAISGALSILTAVGSSGVGIGVILAVSAAISVVAIAISFAATLMAKALKTIVKSIKMLSKINYDAIDIEKLTQLVELLLQFSVTSIVTALGIGALGVALIALGAGISVVSIGLSLLLAVSTGLILAVDKLLNTLITLTDNANSVSKGIKLIGESITSTITNFAIATALGFAIFMQTLSAKAVIIGQSIKNFILTIIDVLIDANLEIAKKIIDGMTDIFTMLEEELPDLFEHFNKVVVLLLSELAENAAVYGYFGSIIASNFAIGLLLGLADAAPTIIDAVVLLGEAIVKALTDTLKNYSPEIGARLARTGLKATKGIYEDLNTFTLGMFNDQFLQAEDEIEAEIKVQDEKIAGFHYDTMRRVGKKGVDSFVDGQNEAADGMDYSHLQNETEAKQKEALDHSEEAGTSAQNTIDTYTGYLNGAIDGLDIGNMKNKTLDYIKNSIGAGSSEGVDEVTHTITKDFEGLSSQAIDALKADGWKLNAAGTGLFKEVSEGMKESVEGEEGKDVLGELGSFLGIDGGTDGIGGVLESFAGTMTDSADESGGNFIDGLFNKLTDPESINLLETASSHDAQAIVGAFNSGLKIESPSKVAMESADYWVQGLLYMASNVNTKKLSDAAISNANSIMNSFDTAFNAPGSEAVYTPTIRPVLDSNNMGQYSGLMGVLNNQGTVRLAADSQVSINNANQLMLTQQIEALRTDISKLANTDFSHMMDGVAINVNADTTVDGTVLRKTASNYTIGQINRKEQGYMMATGGRF